MSKTIIVSNRLPVKITEKDGQMQFLPSEGGLATGLGSIYRDGNNIWVGWPGMEVPEPAAQEEVVGQLRDMNLMPVFLTQDEINQYYEGFSNEILWPVFHYMSTYARYQQSYWDSYCTVNRKFCEAVQKIAEPDDIIWIQDYQLLLLPGMLRKVLPGTAIGYFQHIPFPSFELFRLVPWRAELLEGMLGSDLIGFHTFDDARHFVQATRRLLPVTSSSNIITIDNRPVMVDSFPMGIDSKKFETLCQSEEVKNEMNMMRQNFQDLRIILSIDRLDYSKGIMQRLQAFELLLQLYPEYMEKIALYMIVVPSRDNVPQYKELRDEIDKFVGNINARYRTITWQPVFYFYRSYPVETLSALYSLADVCLVTPMRDGMNLVCKEYIASRTNNTGVLILSEMAGASKELIDAIIVNPNNIGTIARSIKEALNMPLEEQQRRMKLMRQIVSKFNVEHWVKIFMARLNEVKELQKSMLAKNLVTNTRKYIKQLFDQSTRRLIFLDYDGTLVGFQPNIEMAKPDKELYDILEQITADRSNELVIVSGRDPRFLDKWFGKMKLNIIAEHGAWLKERDKQWESLPGLNSKWKKDLLPVLEVFSDRTPGAFIEEKDYSLVWHYRKVDEGLGELRTNELVSTLRYLAEDRGLQLLPGNKVVEVKNVEINKGKAAMNFFLKKNYDFVMALGDDHTDEDIFRALPEKAVTIKVGNHVSAARFYLNNFLDVRRFLHDLLQPTTSTSTEPRPKAAQAPQRRPSFLERLGRLFKGTSV
jgi:trehalose 6-phosphate synthase/phosphatase